MTLYAVVLTFSDEHVKELNKLREKYQRYVSYTIVPHLTLKYPFTLIADIAIVNDKLKAVAGKIKPFTLVLNGIEFFEGINNVAYAAIENKRPVIALHAEIVHSLKGLVKEEDEEIYELDRFTPHVTMGESIPEDVFPAIKKMLADYDLHLECQISAFSLYAGTWDGVWKLESVFELSE